MSTLPPPSNTALALGTLPSEGDVLVDKFRIEGVLGEGGMCVVYAARHLQLEGRVAIKILRPDVVSEAASPEEIVQRFLREGVAASQITSEHVVRTFDVGTLPSGYPFLVMEYLDGHDLDALLHARGPLPIEAAVDYVLQAGEAIAEAHALGIIHRDLKPANLFLTQRADGSPFVKVLDFGISKIIEKKSARRRSPALTGTANVLGTPHYMSPEQLKASRDVDYRTDIWSLGAILHELLSGEPPFKGNTMPEICANILKEPPPPLSPLRPEVPLALQTVVLRCLEKEPSGRFGNMGELATALAEFATPAGRASAQRIAGITRTHAPDQGGFNVAIPPPEAPTWGSTDPSWDAIPASVVPDSRRRRMALVVFGLVMSAMGALLFVEFGAGHARVARWVQTVGTGIAPVPRERGPSAAAPSAPLPVLSNGEVPGAGPATTTTAAPVNAPGTATPVAAADAGERERAKRRAAAPMPQRREPPPAPVYVPRPTAVPSAPAVNGNGNGDGLFEERK